MTISNSQDIRKQFGEHFPYLWSIRKLSQEDLAYLSNLDRSYIGGVEGGQRNIRVLKIKKIADELCISLREFFNE